MVLEATLGAMDRDAGLGSAVGEIRRPPRLRAAETRVGATRAGPTAHAVQRALRLDDAALVQLMAVAAL